MATDLEDGSSVKSSKPSWLCHCCRTWIYKSTKCYMLECGHDKCEDCFAYPSFLSPCSPISPLIPPLLTYEAPIPSPSPWTYPNSSLEIYWPPIWTCCFCKTWLSDFLRASKCPKHEFHHERCLECYAYASRATEDVKKRWICCRCGGRVRGGKECWRLECRHWRCADCTPEKQVVEGTSVTAPGPEPREYLIASSLTPSIFLKWFCCKCSSWMEGRERACWRLECQHARCDKCSIYGYPITGRSREAERKPNWNYCWCKNQVWGEGKKCWKFYSQYERYGKGLESRATGAPTPDPITNLGPKTELAGPDKRKQPSVESHAPSASTPATESKPKPPTEIPAFRQEPKKNLHWKCCNCGDTVEHPREQCWKKSCPHARCANCTEAEEVKPTQIEEDFAAEKSTWMCHIRTQHNDSTTRTCTTEVCKHHARCDCCVSWIPLQTTLTFAQPYPTAIRPLSGEYIPPIGSTVRKDPPFNTHTRDSSQLDEQQDGLHWFCCVCAAWISQDAKACTCRHVRCANCSGKGTATFDSDLGPPRKPNFRCCACGKIVSKPHAWCWKAGCEHRWCKECPLMSLQPDLSIQGNVVDEGEREGEASVSDEVTNEVVVDKAEKPEELEESEKEDNTELGKDIELNQNSESPPKPQVPQEASPSYYTDPEWFCCHCQTWSSARSLTCENSLPPRTPNARCFACNGMVAKPSTCPECTHMWCDRCVHYPYSLKIEVTADSLRTKKQDVEVVETIDKESPSGIRKEPAKVVEKVTFAGDEEEAGEGAVALSLVDFIALSLVDRSSRDRKGVL